MRFLLMILLLGLPVLAQPELMPDEIPEQFAGGVQLALAGREWLQPQEPVVPRYRFETGQKLAWVMRSETEHSRGRDLEARTITLWVLDETPEGWGVVIHTRGEETSVDTAGIMSEPRLRETVEYCDLAPDGRYEKNPSQYYRSSAAFLPLLPRDSAEAASGWEDTDPTGWDSRWFRVPGFDPLDEFLLAIEQDRRGLQSTVYETEYRAVALFDTQLGLPVYEEIKAATGYGRKSTQRAVYELERDDRLDAFELDSFAREADRWFDAWTEWDRLTDSANADRVRRDSLHREADSVLGRALAGLTFPELRVPAETELARYRRYLERMALPEDEPERPGLEGQSAPEWELADLKGRTYRLADLRGTVVVLDFWYRGCPWCIRAMPQLKELRRFYGDKSVAIFGINVDEDTADARFTADKLGLNYPTLLAEGTAEAYGVSGYPTLFVIDREGKVAEVHRGFSEDLGERLRATIDRLLAEK